LASETNAVLRPQRTYFDPPLAIHPDLRDPNQIELGEDEAESGEIAAHVLRILLIAAHDLHDLEHYIVRLVVAFVAAAIALLLLAAVIAGVASL
jgi:hypothetical protein